MFDTFTQKFPRDYTAAYTNNNNNNNNKTQHQTKQSQQKDTLKAYSIYKHN